MIPRSFDYHDPTGLDEALALLREHGEDAKVMAGGQSLLPMMKLRLASPRHVVDLWRIRGLDGIVEGEGEIRIGARVTHRALEDSEVLRRRCPLLAKAASVIGDAQVRNLGTIGGAVAHADPAGDYSPALVALGATLVLRSLQGERLVPAREFFVGIFATALRPAEILTEVRVPVTGPGVGWEYLKLSRRASDFALVSVAAILRPNGGRLCAGADVVLGAVGPVPQRAEEVEAALRGRRLDGAAVAQAARATRLGPETPSDVHADAAYRHDVGPACVRRALEAALARMANREGAR
jgi:carbon-monoxide dehydrogenase medium subunit